MNVVVLDFDGVINGVNGHAPHNRGCARLFTYRRRPNGPAWPCTEFTRSLDPVRVARLNEIVRRTDASIVLSTSWRKSFEVEVLAHLLEELGSIGKVIGETPDLPNDEAWKHSTRGERWIDRIERGHEIAEWLLQHPEVERAVILDDCSDMWTLRPLFAQTDDLTGLLDEDIPRAVETLRASAAPLAALRARWAPATT